MNATAWKPSESKTSGWRARPGTASEEEEARGVVPLSAAAVAPAASPRGAAADAIIWGEGDGVETLVLDMRSMRSRQEAVGGEDTRMSRHQQRQLRRATTGGSEVVIMCVREVLAVTLVER
jgi:hypothetical protein